MISFTHEVPRIVGSIETEGGDFVGLGEKGNGELLLDGHQVSVWKGEAGCENAQW